MKKQGNKIRAFWGVFQYSYGFGGVGPNPRAFWPKAQLGKAPTTYSELLIH